VVRAIEIVERAVEQSDVPVYVRHEIVHNQHVVRDLRERGARFVEELDDIPDGALAIFSAHGVPRTVESEARRRGLATIDATCPLVTRIHVEGRKYDSEGRALVLIGHAGHPEVIGTMGQVDAPVHLVQSVADVAALSIPDDAPVAYVTQSTLSVDDARGIIDALKARFADIRGQDTKDICYATQNRQEAVRDLSRLADLILVVGAVNSSNANRLREIALEAGVTSYLVLDGSQVRAEWLEGVSTVGITAGASTPDASVQDVIAALRRHGPCDVSTMAGHREDVVFRLPPELMGKTVKTGT
jgi:4-hydroxy-3-methylbut-2-enyl diphosphate reductase